MSKQATQWITTKQVCEHLQISRATLYRWKAEGLPFHSARGQLRFDIQEVDDWLRSRCSDPGPAYDHPGQCAECGRVAGVHAADCTSRDVA